ncbi:hypothetical protein [Seonamhaeicola sp. ML3]|uniref:hypothetical protein n=1 Tax=Seonamhaeicola sp. ML3 TaxID=2937786 RepID=UPI00200DDD5E|nr:hypothetical protein [Seonamhaeicola sp. ML3]
MFHKYTLIFLFISISIAASGQSKLEKAEESLKEREKTSRTKSKRSNSTSDSDDNLGEILVKETIGRLAINLFAYTLYGVLIETPFEKDHPSSNAILTKQPYSNANIGNYDYQWNDFSAVGRTSISSRYIFENTTLDGNHLNLDMRFYNKLALELDYLQLWENNPNFGYHTLAIYTALVKYHRIRRKTFDGWWGVGTSYVDGSVNQLGFTFGLGAEAFITKPISIESNFNFTAINGSSITQFYGLINYYINQYKVCAGYERLNIGDQKFSTTSIGLGMSF